MSGKRDAGCAALHEEDRGEGREMLIGIAVGVLVGIIWMIVEKKKKK